MPILKNSSSILFGLLTAERGIEVGPPSLLPELANAMPDNETGRVNAVFPGSSLHYMQLIGMLPIYIRCLLVRYGFKEIALSELED